MRYLLVALALLSFSALAQDSEPPEGAVKLEVWVAPDGAVTDAKVLSSDMPPEFEIQALEAVKKWKFKPKMENGKPVASKGIQVISLLMRPNHALNSDAHALLRSHGFPR
jgi:TonB family protein